MKIRIAVLAACASTLALAQADVAQANYSAAFESKSPVRITDVGPVPAIMVAQNTIDPIPGIDIVVRKNGGIVKRPKAGSGLPNKKVGTARGTLPKGEARRGSKISDNESPRPTDRRILTGAGPGGGPHRSQIPRATAAPIFDRWGNR